MTDEKRGRLVLFGTFAGYSGMINGLSGLGDRLLALGYSTPLLVRKMFQNHIEFGVNPSLFDFESCERGSA
jgi:alpha-aminoadipic semialdehyde synthase